MNATEAIAVIILIIAIVILIYYYLINSPATMSKLRSYVPTSADAHMGQVFSNSSGSNDLSNEEPNNDDSESMTNKIKVKLSDIDTSSLNTDFFSKKIDAFLEAKSDELIKDWSLATIDDLENLESKFDKTVADVDSLEKDFLEFKSSSEEFQKVTKDKLDDLDKRIESLEK